MGKEIELQDKKVWVVAVDGSVKADYGFTMTNEKRAKDDLMQVVYVESREDQRKTDSPDFQPLCIKTKYEKAVENLMDHNVTFTVIKNVNELTIAEEIIRFCKEKNAWALTMGYIGQNQQEQNTGKLRAESDIIEMGSTTFQAISNPSLNIMVARQASAESKPQKRKLCVAFKNVQRAKVALKVCLHMADPQEEVRVACAHFGRGDDKVDEAMQSFLAIQRA